MIKYDRFWETLKKRHISQYYLINECGIEKRLLRRLRDNENVEIFSLDRICTVLNCDLDDIVEYVPNNPDIIEDAKTAQKGGSRITSCSHSIEITGASDSHSINHT